MAEEVSRAARVVREGIDAMRLRASRWGAPRPRFWIDERTTKSCFECGVAFSLVTRKHHCRGCGRVFCQKCSSNALRPRDDPEGPAERACDVCFASHAAAAEPPRASTSSAKKRVSARSPRVPDAAQSRVASDRLAGSSPASGVSSRPASASASRRARERGSVSESASESESDEDESESDEDDDAGASDDDADAVVSDSTREGAACTLTRRDERDPTVRLQAFETRRVDAGAGARDETETPTERRDGTRPKRYRAGKPAYAAHAAALADESLWAPPSPGLEPGTRSTPNQTTTTRATAARDADPVRAALSGLSARFLRRSFGSVCVASSSETRVDAAVATWTRFVSALALECARAVEPSRFRAQSAACRTETSSSARVEPSLTSRASASSYDADPLSYVSIQKIAAGTPARSAVARDAWSLRRNVADRRMAKKKGTTRFVSAERLARSTDDATELELSSSLGDDDGAAAKPETNAVVARDAEKRVFDGERATRDGRDVSPPKKPPRVRVALLGGALEYQRATDKPRLASFSTLLDQEHEHLRAATARALVSKPDVVLVERTVARFARDSFLERGVSLSVGVGGQELRRLAFRLAPRELAASSARAELAADGGAVRGACAGWAVETLEETLRDDDDDDAASAAETRPDGATETRADETEETRSAGGSQNQSRRRKKKSGSTTLMTFHGLTPGSGCVLYLRGASPRALEAVERATRASVRAAYHLDRVAAFAAAAAASQFFSTNPETEALRVSDRFAETLLARAAAASAARETVPLVSRAFCPARVAAHACDPPVGFRSSRDSKHEHGCVPRVVPYGPGDLPLGDALAQATAAERGATECPHARCGEHPAAHVRLFYVPGGRVAMRARRAERRNEPTCARAAETSDADAVPSRDAADETSASVAWTYWSRCRACAEEPSAKGAGASGEKSQTSHLFPRAPARASRTVPAPRRALELSLARFLEMLGFEVDVSTNATDATANETHLAGVSCGHSSPRHRAHYFASLLGTVCFAFDETSPLALVASPSSRLDGREGSASALRGKARYDARCALAASALRSDAYAAAMARSSGSETFGETRPVSDVADVLRGVLTRGGDSDHVVIAEHGVTAYFAPQFRAARAAWWRSRRDERFETGAGTHAAEMHDAETHAVETNDVETIFAAALAECAFWDVGARGGKSRAFFARSRDSRFVVKQVSKVELDFLVTGGFAAAYFARLARTLARERSREAPSLLAATLGAFTVARRADKSDDLDFVVLENAFHGADFDGNASWRAYDLKGSLRGRYAVSERAETSASDSHGEGGATDSADVDGTRPDAIVLMDGNLAETCAFDPILLGRDGFATLESAIRADSSFLAARNVMDYSLLVGFDPNTRREAMVRVIDYLRPYTWDKQIESAVKSGVPSAEGAPTVLSPEKYARRFRRAVRRYFLAAPEDE